MLVVRALAERTDKEMKEFKEFSELKSYLDENSYQLELVKMNDVPYLVFKGEKNDKGLSVYAIHVDNDISSRIENMEDYYESLGHNFSKIKPLQNDDA